MAEITARIERAGLSRAEIGRAAGRDASMGTRWAKGQSLPAWDAANRLADALRKLGHPELAGEVLDVWHHYSDPAAPGPESSPLHPRLLADIRKYVEPERQSAVIGAIERELRGEPPTSPGGERRPSRRAE